MVAEGLGEKETRDVRYQGRPTGGERPSEEAVIAVMLTAPRFVVGAGGVTSCRVGGVDRPLEHCESRPPAQEDGGQKRGFDPTTVCSPHLGSI